MKIIKKEDGSILIVSLVLLVLMTMIGLSASANVVFQTKIVSNELDRTKAFHVAESGIKMAESTLHALTAPVACLKMSKSTEGLNQSPCAETDQHALIMQPVQDKKGQEIAWWASNLKTIIETDGKASNSEGIVTHYAIELVKRIPNSLTIGTTSAQFHDELYRVTSRGIGETASNAVVLQTVFFVRN